MTNDDHHDQALRAWPAAQPGAALAPQYVTLINTISIIIAQKYWYR